MTCRVRHSNNVTGVTSFRASLVSLVENNTVHLLKTRFKDLLFTMDKLTMLSVLAVFIMSHLCLDNVFSCT